MKTRCLMITVRCWKYFILEMRWNVSRAYVLEGADKNTVMRIECNSKDDDWSSTICYTLSVCARVCAWVWSFMCFLQLDHKVEAVSVSRLSKTPWGKSFSAAWQLHIQTHHRKEIVFYHFPSMTDLSFSNFILHQLLQLKQMLDFIYSWQNLSP